VKSYFFFLDGFGQGNFLVKVDHSDSSVNSLEVSEKGSLGLVWTDLVKVVQMQSLRWSNMSRLERWVCRKDDVLVGQSSV